MSRYGTECGCFYDGLLPVFAASPTRTIIVLMAAFDANQPKQVIVTGAEQYE
jgi:hypothetical protein